MFLCTFHKCTSVLFKVCTCVHVFTCIHIYISIFACIWHVHYVKVFLHTYAQLWYTACVHMFTCVLNFMHGKHTYVIDNVCDRSSWLCLCAHVTLWMHVPYKYVCVLQKNEHASGHGACVDQCAYSTCVHSCVHTWVICMYAVY